MRPESNWASYSFVLNEPIEMVPLTCWREGSDGDSRLTDPPNVDGPIDAADPGRSDGQAGTDVVRVLAAINRSIASKGAPVRIEAAAPVVDA